MTSLNLRMRSPLVGNETMTTGNIFFVNSSTGSNTSGVNGLNPTASFATIDAAIGHCRPNHGDIIMVMPGHVETVTSSIAMDVAGVWIRGMGWGNDRPKLTFTVAGASVAMSAASCRISNLMFTTTTVTITNAVLISAAACIVENCEFKTILGNANFGTTINVGAVEDVVIRNNRIVDAATGGATAGISVNGSDYLTVAGNIVQGVYGGDCFGNVTDEVLNAVVIDNIFSNAAATAGQDPVQFDANATGTFARNLMASSAADGFADGYVDGAMASLENYFWDTADESGGLNPSASAT